MSRLVATCGLTAADNGRGKLCWTDQRNVSSPLFSLGPGRLNPPALWRHRVHAPTLVSRFPTIGTLAMAFERKRKRQTKEDFLVSC